MLNGILIVDKPQSFTSHDAVAKLRGILRQKKIGHAGTLDPMATGVLVVLLGNATRASDHASGQDNEYRARLRLGVTTDTQDITGTVLTRLPVTVGQADLMAAISSFTGEIDQLPPMYSALSVGGRRLYDLARKGVDVPRQTRTIDISALELLPPLPDTGENEHELRVVCSKGTYVRTLCHDLGQALGCGGCMAALRRVRSGQFSLADALTLEQVTALRDEGTLEAHIHPTDAVFSDLPAVTLNEAGALRASHGAFLTAEMLSAGTLPPPGERCRVYAPSGDFVQIGETGTLDRGGQAIFCKINMERKD